MASFSSSRLYNQNRLFTPIASMEGNKKSKPNSVDLINNLPDDLLCHVLSFLSTKEAASTSILSKRWSNLLQSVPILDFDDSLLLNPKKGHGQNVVFKEFVDRFLSQRVKKSSPVKKVSLKCRQGSVDPKRLIQWIIAVMKLGVLDLALRFDFKIFPLPFHVFSSKNLVNLRIGIRVRLVQFPPEPFVSPMVKSLVLDSVTFGDDAKFGFKPILSAFPALQMLLIYESNKWNYWNGSVSSSTIRSLVYRSDDDPHVVKPCVSFDTPNLVYLEYSDMVADKYETVKFDRLVEARLDLRLTANQIMRKKAPDSISLVPGNVTTLFEGIRNVQILCLSPDALEAFYYRGDTIPVFNNLVSLSLGSDQPHGSPFIFWQLLPSLLLNSLNLETLIIKGLVHYGRGGWEAFCPGYVRFTWDRVSYSLSSSAVKFLKINGYKGTPQELDHMKRFLGKLSRLEMVRVCHKAAVDNEERCRLMKDLLHLPKASSKCKIQFMKEAA